MLLVKFNQECIILSAPRETKRRAVLFLARIGSETNKGEVVSLGTGAFMYLGPLSALLALAGVEEYVYFLCVI